jgi:hypothetical protein
MRSDIKLIPVPDATSLLYLIEESRRNHVHVVECLREPDVRVLQRICIPIADNETSKVVCVVPIVHLLHEVPLVNLPCKIWSIYPSIAYSCDIELIASVEGERLVEFLECLEGIIRLAHVIVKTIG